MSSLDLAASPSIRRDETVSIALLLAFAGGYLDAHTWIIHGVIANAQTANLVLLGVHGTAGPILAFAAGIVIAKWLRRATGEPASAISTLIEVPLREERP
jgi:uncharacterized membrane protein YoaK (UPF0700 family)